MNDDTRMDNFESAFSQRVSGCVRACKCGREFFDNANGGYDWEEGELEALLKDTKATPLQYAVETIMFEGSEYVSDCDCWHKRAGKIMDFLDSHAHGIADYLTLEKKRKQGIANDAPTVGD